MSPSSCQPVVVPAYTAAQIRTAEGPYLEAGVPLMLRAATALAKVISETVKSPEVPDDLRILFLVGSGNNGGDALFAASQLAQGGAHVLAMPVGAKLHKHGLLEAQASGVRFVHPEELAELALDEFPMDVIVDGILGTGTSSNSALRGTGREVIQSILEHLDSTVTTVIAVDIPSGLHPVTGNSDEVVLPADVTVTFGCLKQGVATEEAKPFVGEIILVDIDIGAELEKLEPVGKGEIARILDATATNFPKPLLTFLESGTVPVTFTEN
ncbi:NAD(P)H-hydrate epimerase [Actinomycetaceae bacterium MB13-C1-2]|nr:NAD(P)H-hydrate epimerase [Actinomycetaceae bacterium MB13-C1-2]